MNLIMTDLRECFKHLELVVPSNGNLYEVINKSLIKTSLVNEKPLHTTEIRGYTPRKDTVATIKRIVTAYKLEFVSSSTPSNYFETSEAYNNEVEALFYNEKSVLFFSFNSATELVAVVASSQYLHLIEKINKEFKGVYRTKTQGGTIHVLVRDASGNVEIRRGAEIGVPLQRDNYEEETVTAYDYIIKNYSSDTPHGRLVILDGAPGTGKTFMVRSLVNDLKGTFILVQAEQISNMDGPEFLDVVLSLHEEQVRPIFFVIEDADDCLVSRGRDNMSSVRSLLNYSDGLLGAALDVRIIATTNAKKTEFDPALQRTGRLLSHVSVGKIDSSRANKIYQRLTGDTKSAPFNSETVLSDVYDLAKSVEEEKEYKAEHDKVDSFEDTKPSLKKLGFY